MKHEEKVDYVDKLLRKFFGSGWRRVETLEVEDVGEYTYRIVITNDRSPFHGYYMTVFPSMKFTVSEKLVLLHDGKVVGLQG